MKLELDPQELTILIDFWRENTMALQLVRIDDLETALAATDAKVADLDTRLTALEALPQTGSDPAVTQLRVDVDDLIAGLGAVPTTPNP
jgi:hypothetical protein